MKVFVMVTLMCLSACSWFGSKRSAVPDPAELIVTGAPAGSLVLVDGAQTGPATAVNDHPQVINVTAGAHKVEIQMGDKVVYREDTDIGIGEHHVVTVLSGLTR